VKVDFRLHINLKLLGFTYYFNLVDNNHEAIADRAMINIYRER
jgi:hypothetical protein